ncbi:1524_t:CDS:1 [Entrophospora sp. SA101]|nr:9336_t:CDS:1 [Entrophospora sp. SA101]CAJ0644796.1 1524_t:CDS:1 [Entrophospora sp. SA101]CAJ0861313.1 1907_t:CDS:1 [Entrophospora sp. SA101]CAJ0875177.1 8453_t:CDS:1 [Entrophospora sp. SA101]CAJ0888177.1 14582_t:CDS:1 [Entrophospora sp. SA101]
MSSTQKINNGTYPVRTILIIGRTGSGKSTLANVITGSDSFEESARSVSVTRNYQIEDYLIDGILYRVVDTVGIGDTRSTELEVLFQLVEAAHCIKYGFNQLLFVTNGRFTETEIKAYDLMRAVVFNEEIIKYTTIVRTNFPEFEEPVKCHEDCDKMIKENGKLSKIIQACNRIIHVDNPPLIGISKATNEEIRKESRTTILEHLNSCNEIYLPKDTKDLNQSIDNYIADEESFQKQINDLNERLQELLV